MWRECLLVRWVRRASLLLSFSFGLCGSLQAQKLSDLAWLEGDWAGTFGGLQFETHYTGPEGGMILSLSKQIREGRVTLFEMERFVEKEGQVILTPFPFGRASSDDFQLEEFEPATRKARFISPEHDFPTEIIYQLVAPDELHITIAGERNGSRVEIPALLKRAGREK